MGDQDAAEASCRQVTLMTDHDSLIVAPLIVACRLHSPMALLRAQALLGCKFRLVGGSALQPTDYKVPRQVPCIVPRNQAACRVAPDVGQDGGAGVHAGEAAAHGGPHRGGFQLHPGPGPCGHSVPRAQCKPCSTVPTC